MTLPASGTSAPATQFSKVDLPAPFGPMIAVICFSGTFSVQPSSAATPPNFFSRPSTDNKPLIPQETARRHRLTCQCNMSGLVGIPSLRAYARYYLRRSCARDWFAWPSLTRIGPVSPVPHPESDQMTPFVWRLKILKLCPAMPDHQIIHKLKLASRHRESELQAFLCKHILQSGDGLLRLVIHFHASHFITVSHLMQSQSGFQTTIIDKYRCRYGFWVNRKMFLLAIKQKRLI